MVLDYDPQCNLSAFFLEEDALFDLWGEDSDQSRTVAGCLSSNKQADGVGGGQIQSVYRSRQVFEEIVEEILKRLKHL